MCSKANLTPGCGEGKYIYCRVPRKENVQLVLKRPELPDGFQGRVFKGTIKDVGCRVPDQFVDILRIDWQ